MGRFFEGGRPQTSLWALGILLSSLFCSAELIAQSAPRFIVSQEDNSELDLMDFQERLSFGLQLYSVIPQSRPFQSIDGSTATEYRYQISGAFGVELFYKFTSNLDLGVSAAWESYESRLTQSGSTTEIQTANMRMFPLEALAKWQWAKGVWAPELEAGFGMGFFKTTLSSTNLAQSKVDDTGSAFLGHIAGGVSLAWMDSTNIGVGLGYRMMFLSQRDFDANIVTIRRGSMSGLFAKANLRYHF